MKTKKENYYRSLIIFLCFFNLLFYSCKKSKKIDFETNKKEYEQVSQCLLANKNSFFEGTVVNAISIYENTSQLPCSSIGNIFKLTSLDFISFQRDSSICFYFNTEKGVKDVQPILCYNPKGIARGDFSNDYTLKRKINNNWAEFERILSLSN